MIQKAHELYNVKTKPPASSGSGSARGANNSTPEKLVSLADRAARNYPELPTIEETADKENDTFAQGGPMAALAHPVKIH